MRGGGGKGGREENDHSKRTNWPAQFAKEITNKATNEETNGQTSIMCHSIYQLFNGSIIQSVLI